MDVNRNHDEAGIPPSVNYGLANMRGAVREVAAFLGIARIDLGGLTRLINPYLKAPMVASSVTFRV